MLTKFLPSRWRVALSSVREDVRATRRAFVEDRHKGVRTRSAMSVPTHPTHVPAPAPPAETRNRPAPKTEEAVAPVIVFSECGVEVELRPGEFILDAGLRQGVDLLFSCTLGGCGACMLQIVEGEVEYDDPDAICLTEDEIADGCCLACVGRPRGRVVVEA